MPDLVRECGLACMSRTMPPITTGRKKSEEISELTGWKKKEASELGGTGELELM